MANDVVYALALSGSTVRAGGLFTNIGGSSRNYIAALDASTGAATSWFPNANSLVYALAVSESTVYAGGSFTSIGGQFRNHIAALDVSIGAATSWNPNANNTVNALAVSGAIVYAGGTFLSIGGQTRGHIAALDALTGSATNWNPNANNTVNALVVSGSTVYAGGFFTSIGGQIRNYIASLDPSTGAATSWNPNMSAVVITLALDFTNARIYAGGIFDRVLNNPFSNFVGLTNPQDPLPITLGSFTAQINPNGPGVLLEWMTISEVNNYGFYVERRLDSEPTFTEVPNSFVPGHGTTIDPQYYSFVDSTIPAPGLYHYRLRQVDLNGDFEYSFSVSVNVTTVGVVEQVPDKFALEQNYPNPFNPSTKFGMRIAEFGLVTLKVYNLLGQEVATLVNEEMNPGNYEVTWDADGVTSGVYFYRLQAKEYVETKKLLLLR